MISICQHWRDYPQHFLFNSQASKQKHLIDITCAMNHVIWWLTGSKAILMDECWKTKRKVEFTFAGRNKTNRVDSPKIKGEIKGVSWSFFVLARHEGGIYQSPWQWAYFIHYLLVCLDSDRTSCRSFLKTRAEIQNKSTDNILCRINVQFLISGIWARISMNKVVKAEIIKDALVTGRCKQLYF